MTTAAQRYDAIAAACRSQSTAWLKRAFLAPAADGVTPFAWRVSRTAIRQVLTERSEFPFHADEAEQNRAAQAA